MSLITYINGPLFAPNSQLTFSDKYIPLFRGLKLLDTRITSSPVPTDTTLNIFYLSMSNGFSIITISPIGLLCPTISYTTFFSYRFHTFIFASLPPLIILNYIYLSYSLQVIFQHRGIQRIYLAAIFYYSIQINFCKHLSTIMG